MPRKYWIYALTFALVAGGDQLSKAWIEANIELWRGHIELIPGFFQLVHYQNKGAIGGVLGDWEQRLTFFHIFAVLALVGMTWLVAKLPAQDRFYPLVVGLMAGGAAGNSIDRLRQGAVTDFLRFYTESPGLATTLRGWFGTAEYPSFNVADMGLSVGIVLFLVGQFFVEMGEAEPALGPEDLPQPEP